MGYNDSDIINVKDMKTGVAMFDKLTRIKKARRKDPLDVVDTITYEHRQLYDVYNLQIGDAYFVIPPEFIMVNSEATSQSIVTLRQENTQKMRYGKHKRIILCDLVFNGTMQINGYPVESPEGTYYVDGLRQLLAQFKCTPFLPIVNEMINGVYGIYTVALQSITISTMNGFPDTMTAQITLQEVNMQPYIEMPDIYFKYMIDWDLFRFYYQSFLTETHEYKKLQSIPANKEHNRFKLSILNPQVFESTDTKKSNMLKIICDKKIVCKDGDGKKSKSNYITWLDSETSDVAISSFQCGYSNILTNIQMSDMGSPTVQFMGGMDTIFNIIFETMDYSVVQALEQCQITNDVLVRDNVKLCSVGFVKLESELTEFTGSLFVMIESVTASTVPGFPGLYNVQINCVSYDIAQSQREELAGFKPFDCDNSECLNNDFEPTHVHSEQAISQSWDGLMTKVKQDNYAEWKLRTSMEVYPDLHLPTYSEVDAFIKKCNKFRKKMGIAQLPYKKYPRNPVNFIHGLHPDNSMSTTDKITHPHDISDKVQEYDIFVDPDFYVMYPASYASFMEDDKNYYGYEPTERESYTKTKTPETFNSGNYSNDDSGAGVGTVSGDANTFLELVKSFIGHQYIYGDNGPNTFDCSGLVDYCLKQMGIGTKVGRINTTTISTNKDLFEEVPYEERQPGDLIWRKGHVVVYQGNGRIVHASNSAPYPKGGVKEDNEYFFPPTAKVFRVKAFKNSVPANVSSGSSMSSATDKERAKQVWSVLKSYGISDVAAAGIMGNISREVGGTFDPTYVEGGTRSDTVSSSGGYGLFQYTYSGYKTGLKEYASKHNLGVNTIEAQVGYMYSIVKDADWFKKMNKMTSVSKATKSFMNNFEKPGVKAEEERITAAEKAYKKYAGTTGNSTTSTTSTASASKATSIDDILHMDLGDFVMPTEDEMNEWINHKIDNSSYKDSPFRDNAKIFIQAAEESGLNPYYIFAHAAWESGYGTSNIAKTKNNYFGIGAFDASPYSSAYTFSSGLAAGIIEGAKWIAKHYYNGEYKQTTLYKMRFNNGEHEYATDSNWANGIAGVMKGMPTGSSQYVLTTKEFESICRVVYLETRGEPEKTQKAVAQVIYDRVTRKYKESTEAGKGKLNKVLSHKMFTYDDDLLMEDIYGTIGVSDGLAVSVPTTVKVKEKETSEIPDEVKENVKAVFCNGERYYKNARALYTMNKNTANTSFIELDKKYDRLGNVGLHTFWGNKDKKSSDAKFIISDATASSGGNGYETAEPEEVTHNAYTLDESNISNFAEPILVKVNDVKYKAKGNQSKFIQNEINSGVNIFNTSFCDMYQYSARGRLVKAFPAYLFCILDDQSQWYDGRKLWTNYYTHKAVVDISVHGTNDMPTETATITVINSYHNLDQAQGGLSNYSIENDKGYGWIRRQIYKYTGVLIGFGPKLTDMLIKLHQVIYKHVKLRENARVHLRMGYGSDPLSLAPVMNGHVSDITLGDQISIVVTSDGHELISHVVSANEKDGKDTNNGFLGLFGLGESQESSNIIANIMVERQSWVSHLMKSTFEGSKHGIEHYGLYWNKRYFKFEVGIYDLWNGVKDQYDILKNIYVGNYRRESFVSPNFAIFGWDKEQNIVFNKYNMTPWDMFQIATQNVQEYIVKSSYHQFDSRLYFGLPSWMEKYRYDWFNGNGGDKDSLVEEYKASTQVHYLDSISCIIDNQVRVTSRFSNTNIKVMFTRGGTVMPTKVLHSDDTIDFAYQKTTILDSPIVQDALGSDFLYDLFSYNIGEESACRVGISNLLYGWQQQYQGNLILMGSPGIKPHDYLMVNDSFGKMYGLCIAREVTHSFNPNTGYTTSVVPGMIGFCSWEESGLMDTCKNYLALLNIFAACTEARRTLCHNYEKYQDTFNNFEILSSKYMASINFKNKMAVASNVAWVGIKAINIGGLTKAGVVGKVFNATKSLVLTVKDLSKAGELISSIASSISSIASSAFASAKTIWTAIRSGSLATMSIAIPGLGTIAWAVVWIAVDALLQDLFEWLENRNVCCLLPMWWDNYPFVSGTKGGEKILLIDNLANATDENDRSDAISISDTFD